MKVLNVGTVYIKTSSKQDAVKVFGVSGFYSTPNNISQIVPNTHVNV